MSDNSQLIERNYPSGATIKVLRGLDHEPVLQETHPTVEEMTMQSLLNTEYLVIVSELTNL